MSVPSLGARGEGWVVGQFVLGAGVLALGIVGPRWPEEVATVLLAAGFAVGIAGAMLLIAGVTALGSSLSPFPRPSARSTLRIEGAYRRVRHPIYGGVLLLALGWSLALSPLAMLPTAILALLLELKSRFEEELLVERYPEYGAYRRRVRWRFIPGVR